MKKTKNHSKFQLLHALTDGWDVHGVLVKCLHGSSPLLEDCVHVTVGAPEEKQTFRRVLRAVLSGSHLRASRLLAG